MSYSLSLIALWEYTKRGGGGHAGQIPHPEQPSPPHPLPLSHHHYDLHSHVPLRPAPPFCISKRSCPPAPLPPRVHGPADTARVYSRPVWSRFTRSSPAGRRAPSSRCTRCGRPSAWAAQGTPSRRQNASSCPLGRSPLRHRWPQPLSRSTTAARTRKVSLKREGRGWACSAPPSSGPAPCWTGS